MRLRNMVEMLGHWRTYVPRDDHLTQLGGRVLLESDASLLCSHRDRGLPGFSATMTRPLAFLDPYLGTGLWRRGGNGDRHAGSPIAHTRM